MGAELEEKSSVIEEENSTNRAVLGGNRQLKNCSRMAIIGHMVAFMIAGMVIGYSVTVSDIDRNELMRDVKDYESRQDSMLHFVNETSQLWRGIDLEAIEINTNDYETRCFEQGRLSKIHMERKTILIEDSFIPFLKHFPGRTQSLVPLTEFEVKMTDAMAESANAQQTDPSPITFWNQWSRNDMTFVKFEDRSHHLDDRKVMCYFVFQREKTRATG